ncbi:hypothetical protein [Amycolatopsis sp. FDAARGOS 1241]|uniref:hypothetical protein n=1 Tax=Amycolatopsis sp. FDAARGOS 1241 TaxID=2778070 RepID=UPI0019502BB4|nr:hypothetical protein [Amycolatopsis sp. FDAARGOS 1241]QRP42870.1 hypothetical protein I6J71_25745 [Amycolatopsis sp. FDAARGOS 1241]
MTDAFLGAVLCPHPPLLLRELAGQQDPIADLRAACRLAVADLLGWGPDRIRVVGPSCPDEPSPPWSLRVARRLLAEAGWSGDFEWHPVPSTATAAECDRIAAGVAHPAGRTALLVMADGSASRTLKAPGYLDERAFAFDDAIVRAVRTNDPAALTRVDATLAEELRAQGRAALHVLGAAVRCATNRPRVPRVHYVGDPFGVLYLAATWACESGEPGDPA